MMDIPGTMIPIVAIIATFSFPVAIVLIIGIFEFMKRRVSHRERMECIRRGQPVPFETRPIHVKKSGPRAGYVLMGLGIIFLVIGLIDFTAALFNDNLGRRWDVWEYFWGLIVLAIGLAMLLYHKHYGEADAALKREAFEAQKDQSKIYLEAFTKSQGGTQPQEPA